MNAIHYHIHSFASYTMVSCCTIAIIELKVNTKAYTQYATNQPNFLLIIFLGKDTPHIQPVHVARLFYLLPTMTF